MRSDDVIAHDDIAHTEQVATPSLDMADASGAYVHASGMFIASRDSTANLASGDRPEPA